MRQMKGNWNLPQRCKKKIIRSSPSMDYCEMSEPSSSLLSTNVKALTQSLLALAAQAFQQ